MASARRVYLIILLVVFVVAATAATIYVRHRNAAKAAANCDTPAPPKPATPPPKLPDFTVEAGCGPGEAPKKR